MTVVDYGCGPGRYTTRLAQLVGLIDNELAAITALPSLPALDLISWSTLSPN